jgi:hypothetical protein
MGNCGKSPSGIWKPWLAAWFANGFGMPFPIEASELAHNEPLGPLVNWSAVKSNPAGEGVLLAMAGDWSRPPEDGDMPERDI